jgi:hypothetical protein
MSGVSESIKFLFNVLISGSFASFWFLQKIKIVVLKKQQSRVEQNLRYNWSYANYGSIDFGSIDFGDLTGIKILYKNFIPVL